jgi:hypothetical protein
MPARARRRNAGISDRMREKAKLGACEIIYIKLAGGKGWKWRALVAEGEPKVSEQTFDLFYDCVAAARLKGYQPNVKCPG